MVRPGFCSACFGLAPSDLAWLNELLVKGRLPWGTLRRVKLSKYVIYRHRRHLDRPSRFPYSSGGEGERRRAEGQRLAPWRWRPGECGRAQSARAKAEAQRRRELERAYREANERR